MTPTAKKFIANAITFSLGFFGSRYGLDLKTMLIAFVCGCIVSFIFYDASLEEKGMKK